MSAIHAVGVDVALDALRALALVVEVVEVGGRGGAGAAQAGPPDDVAADGERAVGADGEAGGVDCAGLRGRVELKLRVGGDVARAALGIG